MKDFHFIAVSFPGIADLGIARAAIRAGEIGVVNGEFAPSADLLRAALDELRDCPRERCGVRLDLSDPAITFDILKDLPVHVGWVIVASTEPAATRWCVHNLRGRKINLLVEAVRIEQAQAAETTGADGVIAKGNESGGWVGEETASVLLQRLRRGVKLPVWVQGGVGRHTIAAVHVGGAAGVVLDAQLALLRESPLPEEVRTRIARMDGSETVYLGAELSLPFRAMSHPQSESVRALRETVAQLRAETDSLERRHALWRENIRGHTGWSEASLWPLGQDACFARSLAERYDTVGRTLRGLRAELPSRLRSAQGTAVLTAGSAWAVAHGTQYPIGQGPMTRVSDTPAFAAEVSDAGGLPFLALGMQRAEEIESLLGETSRRLGARPWGVGMLGFMETSLREEQFAVACKHRPPFAIIAGGQPEQARVLEQEGIRTYLHAPTPGLLKLFVEDGARRFVFEGRECGGHVGPLSSFVLWEQAAQAMLESVPANELISCHVLLAGGIHDARSAAMAAAVAASLAERGVKIGFLMGTAYLFTKEAVSSGAILETFQRQALACRHTALLETGPGHVVRCAPTSYAEAFAAQKVRLRAEGASVEQLRMALETMNIGRLRLAAKGVTRRHGEDGLATVDENEQLAEGLYMLGQAAALREEVCTVKELHRDVSVGGTEILEESARAPGESASRAAVNREGIAIVGMSCLLPGAQDLSQFWTNVLNKTNAIREVPPTRWDWKLYFDERREAADRVYARWGGFLDPIPFDPARYGMPPSSLASIEPIQLLALEVARAALRDAGYEDRPFPRENTSVIIGVSGGLAELGQNYVLRSALAVRPDLPALAGVNRKLPEWTEDSFAGILLNVIAGRVANRFDLGGPSFAVDAACASSLAAVYLACRELESDACDMALVGGADTFQTPFNYLCFCKTHALSPSGRCRTFDHAADGTCISEGLSMLILKRLSDAERDGDRIYAVIKSVGASSDGRAKGLTAPSPEGQARALHRAYDLAGISPATVGLVEAHGTGTVAGDRAEIESLRRVFEAAGAASNSVALGSVKSMIGHTKGAAGATGLLKVALALHHKVLPATLGVEKPSDGLAGGALYANTETRPWIGAPPDQPRRAAVNAFGFGGANYHAVVEEYDRETPRAPMPHWPCELFLWREASAAEVLQRVIELLAALKADAKPALKDLSFTLWRQAIIRIEGATLAIVATSLEDLAAKLETVRVKLSSDKAATVWDTASGVYITPRPLGREGGIAFLFPGQGSQYPDMLRELAVHFHEVREAFEAADRALAGRFDRPLSSFVFPPPLFGEAEERAARQALTATNVAQPALGAAAVGLLDLLCALGVTPRMVAGHSYGEYAALCAAGCLTPEQLFDLSESRGRFILEEALGDLGTMAAVEADEEKTRALVGDLPDLWIANLNSPRQTIVSGTKAAVAEALKRLEAREIGAQSIPVACAFHSPLVAPAKERLKKFLAGLCFEAPKLRVFSNATGGEYPPDPTAILTLLGEHLISPVRFVSEIEAMYAAGARVFVEVGPRSVLTGLTEQILAERERVVVPLETRKRSGLEALLHALAQLAGHGAPTHLDRLYEGRQPREHVLTRLVEETRETRPPATAWWVDGGRATPVHSSEITSTTAPAVSSPRAETRPAAAPIPPTASSQPVTVQSHKGTGDLAALLRAHEQVMQRLLETHRRVMTAALGKAESSQSQAKPAAIAAPAPVSAAISDLSAAHTALKSAALVVHVASESATTPPLGPDTDRIRQEVLRIVGERTGYPPDMLDVDADLEADLGIDSIKRVEIAGRLRKAFPHLGPTPDSSTAGNMASLRTLRGLIERIASVPASGGLTASKPEASAAPTVGALSGLSPKAQTDADHIRREVLRIVGERTGYPLDMLDVDADLEADLGIDSIKRVEIAGRLRKAFPRLGPTPDSSTAGNLASLRTLRELIERITSVPSPGGPPTSKPEASATPPSDTAKPAAALQSADDVHVPRFVMRTEDALSPAAPAALPSDAAFLITDDGRGVAVGVAALIRARGGRAVLISAAPLSRTGGADLYEADFTKPESLRMVVQAVRKAEGRVAGIIHLLPLGPERVAQEMDLATWRHALQQQVKSLFYMAQAAAADLRAPDAEHRVRILAAIDMSQAFPAHGGITGLVNALAVEWPGTIGRTLALSGADPIPLCARQIIDELSRDDGARFVIVQDGRRQRIRIEPAELDPHTEEQMRIGQDWVILLTGGACGITAQVALELAERFKPTLVLTGRSALPAAEEAAATRGIESPEALRRILAGELSGTNGKTALAEIEAAYRRLCREREIRATLAVLRETGTRVTYIQVDVRDGQVFGETINQIYSEFGRLDGVIHGAGVIEDKRVEDKAPESFDRVFDTKADGAFLLERHLRLDSLKFVVFFSSVAYLGNAGQSDYAAANGVLNALARDLDRRMPGRAVALLWGPWQSAGMASEEVQRQFRERGVQIIPPTAGRRRFIEELQYGRKGDVEVIFGDAPYARARAHSDGGRTALPMIGDVESVVHNNGTVEVAYVLDPSRHAYLRDHMLDGKPVFPAAMAMELMAETVWAASAPVGGGIEVASLQVQQGIVLDHGRPKSLRVSGSRATPRSDSSKAVGFSMQIRAAEAGNRAHYRALVTLGVESTTPHFDPAAFGKLEPFPLSVSESYARWLFQGRCFAGITAIEGIREDAIVGMLQSVTPAVCLPAAIDSRWLIDPTVLDASLQLVILWERHWHDMTPLPTQIGRFRLFRSLSGQPVRCVVKAAAFNAGESLTADLYYADTQGRLLAVLEKLECACTKALNRLSDSAARQTSAVHDGETPQEVTR